jgi:hypothetical protein
MNPHEIPGNEVSGQRLRWGLVVFAVIALYFLLTEHRAHTIAALPWLLLLACPLMHFFMHRGHRSHHHDQTPSSGGKQDQSHDEHEHAGHGCC